jgi:HEAT repeat protein
MEKKPVSFEQALDALPGDGTLATRVLRSLSRLDEDRLETLQTVWPALSDDRRAYLAAKLRAMAEIDVKLDFTPIFRFALTDIDERVRRIAVEGLMEDESTSLIDPLVVLLRSDPSERVRAAAARSLGRFLLLSVLDKLTVRRHDQVYSALMGALLTTPDDSPVHRAALRALAYVSNDEMELRVRDAYASEHLPLRVSAVFAMGRSNERKYAAAVMNELHSVQPAMRRVAARASGELELREAVGDLGRLVDDTDAGVRRAAIAALGKIGGDDARHRLQKAAQSDDAETAVAAQAALDEYEFLYGDLKFDVGPFDDLIDGRS